MFISWKNQCFEYTLYQPECDIVPSTVFWQYTLDDDAPCLAPRTQLRSCAVIIFQVKISNQILIEHFGNCYNKDNSEKAQHSWDKKYEAFSWHQILLICYVSVYFKTLRIYKYRRRIGWQQVVGGWVHLVNRAWQHFGQAMTTCSSRERQNYYIYFNRNLIIFEQYGRTCLCSLKCY